MHAAVVDEWGLWLSGNAHELNSEDPEVQSLAHPVKKIK